MDCAALFRAARRRLRLHERRALVGPAIAARTLDILGRWPVQPMPGGFWQPLPAEGALRSEERVIVAVRRGAARDFLGVVEAGVVHGLPTAAGWRRADALACLHGGEIVDLLACDVRLREPPLRFTGLAVALGLGAAGEGSEAGDPPVRIARTVREWLDLAAEGACLPLGDDLEVADVLRGFAGGIVAADLAHGRALKKLLTRDLPPAPAMFLPAVEGCAA